MLILRHPPWASASPSGGSSATAASSGVSPPGGAAPTWCSSAFTSVPVCRGFTGCTAIATGEGRAVGGLAPPPPAGPVGPGVAFQRWGSVTVLLSDPVWMRNLNLRGDPLPKYGLTTGRVCKPETRAAALGSARSPIRQWRAALRPRRASPPQGTSRPRSRCAAGRPLPGRWAAAAPPA